MARNLGLSRRITTKLFRQGRVRDLNGHRLDPRAPVRSGDFPVEIQVDDQIERLFADYHVVLHKPRGVVTAMKDRLHPTAWELLADLPLAQDLRAVGRLDLDTTGLLLWTTRGDLVHQLTHPRRQTQRRYEAALARPWTAPPEVFELDDGHRPNIVELREITPTDAHPGLERPASATHWASITLTSGRFHEVKRIFAALDSEVLALCRVAHGPVELPLDLAPGRARAIDLPGLVERADD